MPLGSPCIISALSNKWSCDHSSYAVFSLQDFSRDMTIFIQCLYRNNILMGCDLKNTVSRCIYDQITCFHMFVSIITDNICSWIWFITENAPSCSLWKLLQHFLWKSIWVSWQWCFWYNTCNLPMSNRRILPCGSLLHPRDTSERLVHLFGTIHSIYVEQSHLL